MKTYNELKTKQDKAVNDIIEKYQVFFAFGNEQFKKGCEKVGASKDNKVGSIGAGGYILMKNFDAFMKAMDDNSKAYKKELKEAKETKEKAIIYELNNHESFYRGNVEPVIELFDGIYTKEEIMKVYKKQLIKERQFINKENDDATLIND